jgi:hypothetical protein
VLVRDQAVAVARWGGENVVTDRLGGPTSTWGFFASKFIPHVFDVKRVQKLMRHGSATATLNTYAGLWPKDDDLARGALTELYREQSEVEAGQPEACGCLLRHP